MPPEAKCEFCEKPATAECSAGDDSPSCEDETHPPSRMCDDCAWPDPVSCIWRCPACAEFYIEYDKEHADAS